MRIDRIALLALLALASSGCVTVESNSSTLSDKMPVSSKADDAKDAARVHTELGQHYMASGDLQTAQEKLTKALQFDPNYAPAHTVLAVLDERINRPVDAELHYRKAQTLEPDKGAPNNNLGVFLCKVGKSAEAQGYFRKAVADPFYQTPDMAWTNAGVCALKSNDRTGAQDAFRQALRTNPQNGDALYQLASMSYLSNDAFRARAFMQRLDALGQPTPEALKLGHDIESRLGDRDGALDYERRLLAQFPDSEQARALDSTASP